MKPQWIKEEDTFPLNITAIATAAKGISKANKMYEKARWTRQSGEKTLY